MRARASATSVAQVEAAQATRPCPYPVPRTAAALRRAPATLLRAAALARAWWRLVLVRVMDPVSRLDQRQQLGNLGLGLDIHLDSQSARRSATAAWRFCEIITNVERKIASSETIIVSRRRETVERLRG